MTGFAFISNRIGSLFWLSLGRWFDKKGLNAVAESCYRNTVAAGGRQAADAAFRLSQILLLDKRAEDAVILCETALGSFEHHPQLWCALGAGRRHLARMDAAGDAYRKAIELDPAYAQAWSNLGEWHLARSEPAEGLVCIERALRLDPGLVEALNNQVAALYELARFGEAEQVARAAIELHPKVAALHANLGNVLMHTGKARQASKVFRTALECDPACAEANLGLATVLGETYRLAEALSHIEHDIAVKGESVQRLAMLALAQHAKKDFKAAEATCNKLLAIQPENVSALITLGACHGARADHRTAIDLQLKALQLNPQMPGIYSNIAFDVTYMPELSGEEVFEYHREWSRRFENNGDYQIFSHTRPQPLGRPMRIGYVSGDFGSHPVGFLLRDVLLHHDKKKFDVYCYSMMRQDKDPITIALRDNAHTWVESLFLSDDELAQRIYDDQIDILVDLSGHTAYNRLPVFLRKPAPVQATWIGYFHSTGLDCIDYFITDPYTTPVDATRFFSEHPVCLPHSRFSYSPPPYAPDVVEPPSLARGAVTFGSFNRCEKLVQPVIEAWTRIVMGTPNARLLLKAGAFENEDVREKFRRQFIACGMDESRLELREPSNHPQMMQQYGEIDIALDPFPFNGGMTTMEALWMGVPVVCIEGQSVVARQSLSMLMNLALPELIFPDVASYVDGCIALAGDPVRLRNLRLNMRNRMLNSPLCQTEQFAQDLELLYERMMQQWHKGELLDMTTVSATPAERRVVLHMECGRANIRSMPLLFQSRWREIRVDPDPDVVPDIVADLRNMSGIATGSVDAVYSSHNIAHLYHHEVAPALREFHRLLKSDGMLVVTSPDLQSIGALMADDKLDEPAYVSPAGPVAPLDMLFGFRPNIALGSMQGVHRTGFTASSLAKMLAACGFHGVEIERGDNFDLWALAYANEAAPERVMADKALAFPKRRDN